MTALVTIADQAAGLFDGRYDLETLLGTGQSGEVWRARDTTTGRIVALKVLDGTKTTPDAAWQEATRLTSLESPRLVRVHGAALAIDVPYLDMELAAGGSAADAASPYGVAPYIAVRWTRQVSQGLHLCHQRSLLHRDVKSANVFLDGNGDARLGDFGVTAVRGIDGTASVGGDPQIRAPEVLKGGPCSVASEVYALGVCLYSLLTGRLPFRWEDHDGFAGLKAAALAGPPDIRTVAPHVDLPLARIVRKATAQRPEDRYESGAKMDAALAQIRRPNRDITEVSPHSDAARCWNAEPSAASGPTSVHVCIIPTGQRFDVRTHHVPSGNRIVACCDRVTSAKLPAFLRSAFAALR